MIIPGTRIVFEKVDEDSPRFWSGSVQIESKYKAEYVYVSCEADNCIEAVRICLERFQHKKVLGISLKNKNA